MEKWKEARRKMREAIDILKTNYKNEFIIYDVRETLEKAIVHLNNLEKLDE